MQTAIPGSGAEPCRMCGQTAGGGAARARVTAERDTLIALSRSYRRNWQAHTWCKSWEPDLEKPPWAAEHEGWDEGDIWAHYSGQVMNRWDALPAALRAEIEGGPDV